MSEVRVRSSRVSLERGDNPLLYAQRLYTAFLQGLFNFNHPGCFHWEPDEELTEILIRAEAPVDLRTAGKRPAITSVLGPIQYQGLTVDQTVAMNLMTESQRYSDLISSHLIMYCIAESDIIAQYLAHIVLSGTMVNRRLLESEGGFHQISRPAPSSNPPSPPGGLVAGDPTGLVMVQVNIPFTFQWTWVTTQKGDSRNLSLDMVTSKTRASDFPYTPPSVLESVRLSLSLKPVIVRRFNRGRLDLRQVTNGFDEFQIVITDTSSEEA